MFSRTVLVYRDTLLPPSETFIRNQAESLRSFSAVYVCLRRTPGLNLPEDRVHRLCSGRNMIGRVQRIRFKLLGPTRSQTRALAGRHPALVHAHFAPNGCDVITLARGLGIPLVVSLHGYEVNSNDDQLARLYLRRRGLLMNRASRFICVSEFIRSQALAKGFPAEKTVVHYTGVDTEFFSPDPATVRSPIVLFVGRLAPEKGCEYLIQAMAEIQESSPGAALVVIGDGPERQRLEKEAETCLSRFEFLGVQPPSVVKEWMNRARVFCAPCIVTASNQEGFGMTFAEAQSMGLPVVSTSVGGIPEAVVHGKTGFLVSERDPQAVAGKLLLLLRDPNLWTAFSRAGRTRTRQLFNIYTQAAQLERIYCSAVEKQGSEQTRRPTMSSDKPTEHLRPLPAQEEAR